MASLRFRGTHHAPSSQKRYKAILDNLKTFLLKFPYIKKVSQLDSKFFEHYQTHRKVQGAANKTVNIELIYFKAMYSLRHTFASHLVMSGVDLPTVKKLLGHADIETTMIYAHLADGHVDKAVEQLSF